MACERVFDIPTFDNKFIWCCLTQSGENPSEKAIILGHGLTGSPDEYIHMAARDYFTARGYDVYRMAFYQDGPHYRILRDCTLDIHAKDMNAVIAHVRKTHKKVFACGHSYGGMTMLMANPATDAICFWDSSYTPWNEFWRDQGAYLPELDLYTIGWGSLNLIGKAMYEEAQAITAEKSDDMARRVSTPACVITAEQGSHEAGQRLFDNLSVQKEFHCIPGADHCFTRGNTIQTLLKKTGSWFDSF